MTKKEELNRILSLLQKLPLKELKSLRKKLSVEPRKVRIPKGELRKFVKENRSTRSLAQHYKVSSRTITRRIKEHNLVGLRPKGRKPRSKARKKRRAKTEWVSMRGYFTRLNKIYRFANIKIPPKKWINPRTLVASNKKENPEGDFTTVGIYYIVEQSNVYLIYTLSIRYTEDPIPFEEIYTWIYPRVYDIVVEHSPRTAFVVDVVALTFEKTADKPEKIEVQQ